MTEFKKLTPLERKIFCTIYLVQEMIDYGMKYPESDIGKLMRLGT